MSVLPSPLKCRVFCESLTQNSSTPLRFGLAMTEVCVSGYFYSKYPKVKVLKVGNSMKTAFSEYKTINDGRSLNETGNHIIIITTDFDSLRERKGTNSPSPSTFSHDSGKNEYVLKVGASISETINGRRNTVLDSKTWRLYSSMVIIIRKFISH